MSLREQSSRPPNLINRGHEAPGCSCKHIQVFSALVTPSALFYLQYQLLDFFIWELVTGKDWIILMVLGFFWEKQRSIYGARGILALESTVLHNTNNVSCCMDPDTVSNGAASAVKVCVFMFLNINVCRYRESLRRWRIYTALNVFWTENIWISVSKGKSLSLCNRPGRKQAGKSVPFYLLDHRWGSLAAEYIASA